jgi:phosphoribosyl 1,2-cyclic phosphodiesterase
MVVQTIPTPHDAADGVGFVVTDGARRLGVLTDLGHVFAGLGEVISTLDAVFLESNYDPHMLANGPYPLYLQERIAGDQGHLSNAEAAKLLHAFASGKLQWVCLAHLSEQNNTPQLAIETHESILRNRFPLHVASRYESTGAFEV